MSKPYPISFRVNGLQPGETPTTTVRFSYTQDTDIEGWLHKMAQLHGNTFDLTVGDGVIEVVFR